MGSGREFGGQFDFISDFDLGYADARIHNVSMSFARILLEILLLKLNCRFFGILSLFISISFIAQ